MNLAKKSDKEVSNIATLGAAVGAVAFILAWVNQMIGYRVTPLYPEVHAIHELHPTFIWTFWILMSICSVGWLVYVWADEALCLRFAAQAKHRAQQR